MLFVLMMATGTAVFAMQSTQFEQRAAGSLHQAMRTRYIAEAATVSVLSLCYQLGTTGCADIKRAQSNLTNATRERYALPGSSAREVVYQLGPADMTGNAFPKDATWTSALVPTDGQIAGGGAAMAYTPTFDTVMEKWEVPNPGETRQRYRLIVSTYGQLGIGDLNKDGTVDDVKATDESRFGHESISATRAFFDVR